MRDFLRLPSHLKIIVLSSFFMALGSFMVTPFVAVYLHQQVRLNIQLIGFVVALSTFIQFAGGLVGAVIAERIGYKKAMVLALVVRVSGFLTLAYAAAWPALSILAVLVITACSALYMPANKAYTIATVADSDKPLLLSLNSVAMNAGMAIGPIISGLVMTESPRSLFTGVAILFLVLVLVHERYLAHTEAKSLKAVKFVLPLPNHRLATFKVFLMSVAGFYFYFLFQNFMSLHITAVASASFWGFLLFVNFIVLASTQFFGRKLITSFSFSMVATLGMGLIGFGFLLMSQSQLLLSLPGTASIAAGAGIIFLKSELEMVANNPLHPALAFGQFRLATGLGGLLSGVLGGALYRLSSNWYLISFQALILSCVIFAIAIISNERKVHEVA